jgi:hypothetical protein
MIPVKVIRRGIVMALRVLEAHVFQYLESMISNSIQIEMIRQITTKASKGKDVFIFNASITIPIQI